MICDVWQSSDRPPVFEEVVRATRLQWFFDKPEQSVGYCLHHNRDAFGLFELISVHSDLWLSPEGIISRSNKLIDLAIALLHDHTIVFPHEVTLRIIDALGDAAERRSNMIKRFGATSVEFLRWEAMRRAEMHLKMAQALLFDKTNATKSDLELLAYAFSLFDVRASNIVFKYQLEID